MYVMYCIANITAHFIMNSTVQYLASSLQSVTVIVFYLFSILSYSFYHSYQYKGGLGGWRIYTLQIRVSDPFLPNVEENAIKISRIICMVALFSSFFKSFAFCSENFWFD